MQGYFTELNKTHNADGIIWQSHAHPEQMQLLLVFAFASFSRKCLNTRIRDFVFGPLCCSFQYPKVLYIWMRFILDCEGEEKAQQNYIDPKRRTSRHMLVTKLKTWHGLNWKQKHKNNTHLFGFPSNWDAKDMPLFLALYGKTIFVHSVNLNQALKQTKDIFPFTSLQS